MGRCRGLKGNFALVHGRFGRRFSLTLTLILALACSLPGPGPRALGHEVHELRHDLDLAPLLPGLLVVPAALLEPAVDEDRVALVDILAAGLRLLAEDDDIKVADLVLDLFALLVLAIDGDGKTCHGDAVRRVPHLGITGKISHQNYFIEARHGAVLPPAAHAAAGPRCGYAAGLPALAGSSFRPSGLTFGAGRVRSSFSSFTVMYLMTASVSLYVRSSSLITGGALLIWKKT